MLFDKLKALRSGTPHVSIHSRPVRRLTPQPTDRGRADCPSLKGEVTEKDFIGSAVLSTTLFPLKGEVSNHKGIFDEDDAQEEKEKYQVKGQGLYGLRLGFQTTKSSFVLVPNFYIKVNS